MYMSFIGHYIEVEYKTRSSLFRTQLRTDGVITKAVASDLLCGVFDLREEWFRL